MKKTIILTPSSLLSRNEREKLAAVDPSITLIETAGEAAQLFEIETPPEQWADDADECADPCIDCRFEDLTYDLVELNAELTRLSDRLAVIERELLTQEQIQ